MEYLYIHLQDFMNLKKQFESRNRAHEHILANNASTIQEMEGTIFDLRNQLKETLHTNYKVKQLCIIYRLLKGNLVK